MHSTFMSKVYQRAKKEGRLCSRCGWIISAQNWKKGYRLCGMCWSALKGVNVDNPHGPYLDEPREMTGEM